MIIFSDNPDSINLKKKYKNVIKDVALSYTQLTQSINKILLQIRKEFDPSIEFPDHDNIKNNKHFSKRLENSEKIIYSCKIVIGKGWFFKKKRSLVLSNQYIYLLKSSIIKRRILNSKIQALTTSSKSKVEIVIHIED